MTQEAQRKRVVFISYSRADGEPWLRRLLVHLKPLTLKYEVEIWSDVTIEAGDEWRRKIDDALGSANIFVLLLSADFLASEFINRVEVPKLLEAARDKRAVVLPVVVRDCLLSADLLEFQSVNKPEEPLQNMTEGRQEGVFKTITARVAALLGAAGVNPAQAIQTPAHNAPPAIEGDCHWYAQRFGALIRRQNSMILLNCAVVTVSVLIWLALLVAAYFFEQDLSVPRLAVGGGFVPCLGLTFYRLREVVVIRDMVVECKIMKDKFDNSAGWSQDEFERNVRRAEDLLRRVLGEGGRHDS